jgi:hypothetical protein
VLIALSFVLGAISASYVWGKTIERVTYQHALECMDMMGKHGTDPR